jgi:hypothetical protein
MTKKILIGLAVALVAFLAFGLYGTLYGPKKSPEKTTTYSDQGLDIKVVFSQPSKKGRLIFGEEKAGALQPYGKYWRLGANFATEITFSKAVTFAGTPVKAGSYRMYAVPNATTWQVSLNSELGKFGFFEPDYSKDVVKVDVPVSSGPETELLTINFSSDSTTINMDIVWDTTVVRVPLTVQ